MNKRNGLVLIAMTSAVAFAFDAQPPASQPIKPAPTSRVVTTAPGLVECDEKEYAVFAAVIQHLYGDGKVAVPIGLAAVRGLMVNQFAVAVRTRDYREGAEVSLEAPHLLSKARDELEATFAEINRKSARIDSKRMAVKGIEIIPVAQDDYEEVARSHHSTEFPRTQGLSLFSRVAFSKDGQQACVSLDTREGQFGYGMIFFLEYDQAAWHVTESDLSWIN